MSVQEHIIEPSPRFLKDNRVKHENSARQNRSPSPDCEITENVPERGWKALLQKKPQSNLVVFDDSSIQISEDAQKIQQCSQNYQAGDLNEVVKMKRDFQNDIGGQNDSPIKKQKKKSSVQ